MEIKKLMERLCKNLNKGIRKTEAAAGEGDGGFDCFFADVFGTIERIFTALETKKVSREKKYPHPMNYQCIHCKTQTDTICEYCGGCMATCCECGKGESDGENT